MTPDELLRIVLTPTRLGQHLVPELWGEGSIYDIDPWLALTEQRVLEAVLDRDHQRFVRAHVPPQVGKTTFSCLFLPFWILGMFPESRIILVTYSDDYSRLRGGEVRDLIAAFGRELFGIEIDPNRDAAADWRLAHHRGGMLSVGVGSQLSGRSGDIVIIDDLIKNIQEATSVATKSLHIKEYGSTIRPRLQPRGTIIMTSTRWAEDDLAGWIGSRQERPGYNGEMWEELSFPAIAEPRDQEEIDPEAWRDILGRQLEEPLQCRFTDPELAWEDTIFHQLRRSADDMMEFSCVFQQNPINSDAGMFPPGKWRRYRKDELPKMRQVVRIWDPAATEGGGDWSVGLKIGRGEDDRFYILDVWRNKFAADAVLDAAVSIARADTTAVEVGVEQEKAGAGKGTVRFWELEMLKHGVRVFPCKVDNAKEVRAKPASTLQQGGQLLIPHDDEGVDWVHVLIDQARRMMGDGRRGRNDDMIDCLSHGVEHLLEANSVEFWDPSDFNPAAQSDVEGALFRHLLGLGH